MESPKRKIPEAKKVFAENPMEKQWRPGIRRTGEKGGLKIESKSAHEKSPDEVHIKPENLPSPEEEKQKLKSLVEQFPANIWGLDENYVKSKSSKSAHVENGSVWGLTENYDEPKTGTTQQIQKPVTFNENLGGEHASSTLPEAPATEPAPQEIPAPAAPVSEGISTVSASPERVSAAPVQSAPEAARRPEAQPAPETRVARQPQSLEYTLNTTGPEIDTALPEGDKKILRLALTTRGTEAMQELQAGLKHLDKDGKKLSNGTQERVHAQALVYAEKMFSAEKDYFKALKEFHKTKGFHSVIGDAFFSPDGRKLPPDVQALKDTWIASRAGYAAHMKNSAAERHVARRRTSRGRTRELLTDKVLERYQRRFITKEVLLGAEKAEYRARMEGLNSRDKKGIEKFFDKYKKQFSTTMRSLSSIAMLTAGGVAAAAGSTFFAPIALALGGTSAIANLGSILTKEGSTANKIFNKAAGLLSFGGIFGLGASKGTGLLHKLSKTQEKADSKLNQRDNVGDLSNASSLREAAAQRRRATLASERIDRDKRAAGIATSIAAGAVIGGGLHSLDHGAVVGAVSHDITDKMSIGEHVRGANVYDADRLLGHFAQRLQHNDFPHGGEPPAVSKLYELLKVKGQHSFLFHTGENQAAISTGFEGSDGSTIMQPGDTMSLHNGEIFVDRPGHPEMHHLLIDKNQVVHPMDPKVWHMAPVHHHTSLEAQAPPAQTTPETAPIVTTPDASDHADVGLNNAEHQADLVRDQQPPAPAPEAPPQSPIEQAAPVSLEQPTQEYYFAGATHYINPYGVDLGKPDIFYYNGHPIAHGLNNEDSFRRASETALKLAASPNHGDTRAYFVSQDKDLAGNVNYNLRAVYVPPAGGAPQLWSSPTEHLPPLPKPHEYQPLPRNFPR